MKYEVVEIFVVTDEFGNRKYRMIIEMLESPLLRLGEVEIKQK